MTNDDELCFGMLLVMWIWCRGAGCKLLVSRLLLMVVCAMVLRRSIDEQMQAS